MKDSGRITDYFRLDDIGKATGLPPIKVAHVIHEMCKKIGSMDLFIPDMECNPKHEIACLKIKDSALTRNEKSLERYVLSEEQLEKAINNLDASRTVAIHLSQEQAKNLEDILLMTNDEGPEDGGWASPKLEKLRGIVYDAISDFKANKCPCDSITHSRAK